MSYEDKNSTESRSPLKAAPRNPVEENRLRYALDVWYTSNSPGTQRTSEQKMQ